MPLVLSMVYKPTSFQSVDRSATSEADVTAKSRQQKIETLAMLIFEYVYQ